MKLITRTLTLAALFASGSTLGSTVWAAPETAAAGQTMDKKATDPAMVKAQQMLKDSAAAYKALDAYSSDVTWKKGSAKASQTLTGHVAWQRPDQLMAEVKMGDNTFQKYLSGGKLIETKVTAGQTMYTSVDTENAAEMLPEALGELGPVGLSLGTFLTDTDPLEAYGDDVKTLSARAATAEEAQGLDLKPAELQTIEIKLEIKRGTGTMPVQMTYVLGEKDKLVRSFSVNYQVGEQTIAQTETYTEVKVNPQNGADALKFVPAAGAELVDDLNPTYDTRLRTGAAPIALNATDLQGAPISFDQYKGKVVLVDFWATWCPPCRAEMPNVIATYNKYHDKGFDIVGISLDQDKAALDKYIAENKMPWRQVFDGKGWDSEVGKNFGVRAIPFAMIIGRDGKIAALNARGEGLEKAVAKALDAPA